VAGIAEPPLRLLLGSDAVQYAAAVARTRDEGDARWRDLSMSIDAGDGTAPLDKW
jgi:hypothetical protein